MSVSLELTDVSKRYGDRRVLDGVSFKIDAGERVALVGPSGAGKSTLLNCIGGIDRPDSGTIAVAGNSLADLDAKALDDLRRKTVTTVFQFFHLLPTLTAAENIELPLQLLGMAAAERAARVRELLAATAMMPRAAAFPDQLSGGEMQRVAIARALAPRPALVLADEPTGNLDTSTGDVILALIERLSEQHGFALLLVTHSERATAICRRTLHLRDGRMEENAGA